MKPRVILLSALLGALLSACTAISYDPMRTDSPRPNLAGREIPFCMREKGVSGKEDVLTRLEEPGHKCLALVRANQPFSSSNLRVKPNEAYRVIVPAGQFWYDANRRSVPPQGDDGSWLMNRYQAQKRHTQSRWFALMAGVTSRSQGVPRLQQCADVSQEYEQDGFVLHVVKDGELGFYPNDANSMMSHPWKFYQNNAGQIWVLIERLQGRASAASPTASACDAGPSTN